jgi:hypothetical protein
MHVEIRILSVIWKFIIAAVVGTAVIVQFGGLSLNPSSYSLDDLTTLSYLTVFFNIFVALYFLADGLWVLAHGGKDDRGKEWCVGLKHTLIVSMLCIGVVANGFLSALPIGQSLTVEHSSAVLAYYSPIMIALDWLVFEKKGQMHVFSPVLWLIFPAIYLALVFAGMRYYLISAPYSVLDVRSLGTNEVALVLIGMAIVFLVVGVIVFAVDLLMSALGGMGGHSRGHRRKRSRSGGSRGSSHRGGGHSSKGGSSSQNKGGKSTQPDSQDSDADVDEAYRRSYYDEETPYDGYRR